jgi:hypothetical protein
MSFEARVQQIQTFYQQRRRMPSYSEIAAITQARHQGERGDVPERQRTLLKGETARRRLGLPFLGEVR